MNVHFYAPEFKGSICASSKRLICSIEKDMTNLSRRRYLAIKIEQTFVLFNEGYTINKVSFSIFVEFDDSERCHAKYNFSKFRFMRKIMHHSIDEYISIFHGCLTFFDKKLLYINYP